MLLDRGIASNEIFRARPNEHEQGESERTIVLMHNGTCGSALPETQRYAQSSALAGGSVRPGPVTRRIRRL